MTDYGKAALMEALRSPDSTTPLIEMVTSTNREDGAALWYQAMSPAETLLARYAEITDAIEAARGTECFPLWKRHDALLVDMRAEGARIRVERGSGLKTYRAKQGGE